MIRSLPLANSSRFLPLLLGPVQYESQCGSLQFKSQSKRTLLPDDMMVFISILLNIFLGVLYTPTKVMLFILMIWLNVRNECYYLLRKLPHPFFVSVLSDDPCILNVSVGL